MEQGAVRLAASPRCFLAFPSCFGPAGMAFQWVAATVGALSLLWRRAAPGGPAVPTRGSWLPQSLEEGSGFCLEGRVELPGGSHFCHQQC